MVTVKQNFARCVGDAAPCNLNITKLLILRFWHFKIFTITQTIQNGDES